MTNKNFKKQEATKLARLFEKGYLKERKQATKFWKDRVKSLPVWK